MYISKNATMALSPHFVDHKVQTCEKCQSPEEEPDCSLEPAILSLIILNRCYTYQIEAMILNQVEDLRAQVSQETQKQLNIADFNVDPHFFEAVWLRLQEEIAGGDFGDYYLIQMLMRALANIVILT